MEASLLQPLEASLQKITNSYCGRTSHLFTKRLEQSIRSVQQEGRHAHVLPWPPCRHFSGKEEEEQRKMLYRVSSLHIWFWDCGIEEAESVDAHLSECFQSYPSHKHTIRSHCGGTCTINTLPCRDFTLTGTESRQSADILLFGGSVYRHQVQSILQFQQEIQLLSSNKCF